VAVLQPDADEWDLCDKRHQHGFEAREGNHTGVVVPEKVLDHAQPAIDTLAQTLLGSGFVLALVVAAIAIWQLITVQNARVKDQKEIADRVEKMTTQVSGALQGTKGALESLERAQQALQLTMTTISTKIDFIVSSAPHR